jgi:uncharacterized MAPEG superfamily protein
MTTLSTELYWLTLTVLMTGLMWLPYILNRIIEQGIVSATWDPQGETATKVAWADRMARAHANAVENLVIFAPLVLAVELTNLNSEFTTLACIVYFFSRLTHFVVFTFGVPVLRVITFMVSVGAQLLLAFTLLGVV